MLIGLHNVPATWQRFVAFMIDADLEPHVSVYLNDIIVINDIYERHLEVLQEIFTHIRAANVTLKKSFICVDLSSVS